MFPRRVNALFQGFRPPLPQSVCVCGGCCTFMLEGVVLEIRKNRHLGQDVGEGLCVGGGGVCEYGGWEGWTRKNFAKALV